MVSYLLYSHVSSFRLESYCAVKILHHKSLQYLRRNLCHLVTSMCPISSLLQQTQLSIKLLSRELADVRIFHAAVVIIRLRNPCTTHFSLSPFLHITSVLGLWKLASFQGSVVFCYIPSLGKRLVNSIKQQETQQQFEKSSHVISQRYTNKYKDVQIFCISL